MRYVSRIDAQQRPPDVHRVPIQRVVERGWVRHGIWMETEAIANLGHETQSIDDFGEGVSFLRADTVNDDVSLAGKPA